MTKRRNTPTRFRPQVEALEAREVPAALPYLVPSAPGVETTPLLTVGDAVGDYRFVGIPDGMGAYDNGDGTFSVLINHELGSTLGITRDHGSAGSFVSQWTIRKSDLAVLSGDDLIKNVNLWDVAAGKYVAATTAFNRLCSADLPAETAFYNPATGLGSTARIFMNGEETSNGRAFAHVVTGPEAGSSWELPWVGKYAWENHVASPFAQDKTIVVGLDDSRREFSSEGSAEPSEVYVWVGQKQATGIEIEKAGLTDGLLYGLRVGLPGAYDANEGTVASGERFELVGLDDPTADPTFVRLQTESIAESITQFRRVEDGHFDPTDPNVFYFVTTDRFGGSTRLWKLTFDDIKNPEAGGVIEIALDSPAGVPGEMFDNITVNAAGDVILQEDPGNNPYIAKVWHWDAPTGVLTQIAEHNPALFGAAGIDLYPDAQYPQYPGAQGTQDEESSGVIDVSHILGKGKYLAVVQAHYRFGALDPELVEAGQLLVLDTNAPKATLVDGVLTVTGTIENDAITVTRWGRTVVATAGTRVLGTFDARAVKTAVVDASNGNDVVYIAPNFHSAAVVLGGSGNDRIFGGGGRNILIGGTGSDRLFGGSDSDILIGGDVTLTADEIVENVLPIWTNNQSYAKRVAALNAILAPAVVDDGTTDWLFGLGGRDWFFVGPDDRDDAHGPEVVN